MTGNIRQNLDQLLDSSLTPNWRGLPADSLGLRPDTCRGHRRRICPRPDWNIDSGALVLAVMALPWQYLILTREFTRCSPSSSCGSSSYCRCCCFCQGEIRNDTKRYDSPAPKPFWGFLQFTQKDMNKLQLLFCCESQLEIIALPGTFARTGPSLSTWVSFIRIHWGNPPVRGWFDANGIGLTQRSLQPSQVWLTNHEPTNQIGWSGWNRRAPLIF